MAYHKAIVSLLLLHLQSKFLTSNGEVLLLDLGDGKTTEVDTDDFNFRSLPLDKGTLDELELELDEDHDGTVSWPEFQKLFSDPKEEQNITDATAELTTNHMIFYTAVVVMTTLISSWYFYYSTRDCRGNSDSIRDDPERLRQIRTALLSKKKGEPHSDDDDDDSHHGNNSPEDKVTAPGNNPSTQGGSQQSGGGQQSSSGQQSGGGQSSSRGQTSGGVGGQGSSAGGDGNDEEDREKKSKQPRIGYSQDQEEEGEEDEQEVGGAISKTQSSTQPAVKKLRVMEDAGSDVRLKRLARLQQQSQPVQVTSPTPPPIPVSSKEPEVRQPVAATSTATATTVVKPTATTPTKKVTDKMASPVKELTMVESQSAVLSHLFCTKVVISSGGSGGEILRDSHKVMKLDPSDVPADPGMSEKFKLLLLRRLSRELDVVKVLVVSYNRACSSPPPGVQPTVWSQLTNCSKDVVAVVLLEQLKEGVQTVDVDDIWSVYSSSSKSQGSLATFITLLSSWSPDGVTVPPELLTKLLTLAKTELSFAQEEFAQEAFTQLVKTAGLDAKNASSYEEIALDISKSQSALSVLFGQSLFSEFVGEQLLKEVSTAIHRLGIYFEKDSMFSGFLSPSTIPGKLDANLLKDKRFQSFVQIRGFPDHMRIDDIKHCCQPIQDGLHKCQECVTTGFLKVLRTSQKSNAIGWLASVVGLNELRCGPQFRQKTTIEPVASDGYMLNFSAVLVQLCQPFFGTAPNSKLAKIDPSYCTSLQCRLDLHNEPCLAHGNISAEESLAKGHERYFPTSTDYNFMTEIFHITQRGLHVGLMAAIRTFGNELNDLNRSIDNDMIGEDRKSVLKSFRMLYVLTWDCCLTDPHFVRTCSEFYITQAVWLMMQLQKEDQQSSSANPEAKHVMACIPEYSIKDMVGWFRFVAGNHPRLLSGLELTPFVDCCVTLLQRQDILTGPVAQSKVVSVLLSFTEGSNQASNKSMLSGSGWGSGVHGHLASLVHTNPMVQEHLGPALMSTYIAVDQIEGLDVDKEDFDKYQARYGITQLVEQLWGRADCRASILKQCRSKRFQSFLGAVFDTLLYQLTDSLHRLGNVKKIEVAQEDKEHWNQLSPRERAEKERFVAGEKRVTKGFMSMGTTLLDLLNQMVECGEVAACFCIVPLSSRVAAAIFGFLNLLCGPKASELKVKDMDKYSFQPYALLTQLVNILLMICRQEPQPRARDGFVSSLALHPDYDRVTMDKVVSVIQRKGSLSDDVVTQLTSLIEEVETIQAKERENDEAALESAEPLQASSGGGAKFGGLPPWQQEAESCVISKDDLNSIYVEALKESQYDCSEISESHALESHAVQTLDPRSSKTKALMKEMESLPEMLPLHIDSSVFILQDEDRMDLVRAIVTGPADTPYSKGCFVFDIYFPATYPAVPPLVKLITTGNGTIRFNPNLYADGKVCLSLLGTWHGGDATEKWNPQNSTLFQVLVSIQGLILIKDPMFNEPSYERIQGTEEGNAKSAEYNSDLHVHTVRYAMLEQLRNPPAGCEDIIKVHFTIQRDAVLKQCSEWLRQAVSTDQERRLRKAVDELRAQMDKIQ